MQEREIDKVAIQEKEIDNKPRLEVSRNKIVKTTKLLKKHPETCEKNSTYRWTLLFDVSLNTTVE